MENIIITEITERYIGCRECGLERSYRLSGIEGHSSFVWHCPQCQQPWAGRIEEDQKAVSIEKRENGKLPRLILVELDEEFDPTILMTIRRVALNEGSNQRAFHITNDEVNELLNPFKYEQFKTSEM